MTTPTTSPWGADRQGAVSLTFDDGMISQLETAIPLLDEHELTGSFYVNPRDGWEEALLPWRAANGQGHEIGNHTVSHPCSANFAFISGADRPSLEEMTLDEMEGEILETRRRLETAIPEQGPVSFAYPCYQPFVGRGLARKSYAPLIAQHCAAGRGRGEQPNDPVHCDLAYLWSSACERMTGAELVGLAEQAAAQGRWAILTFHGINEGHLSVSEGDLAELCAFLARQSDRIWTAPVAEIANSLVTWRQING